MSTSARRKVFPASSPLPIVVVKGAPMGDAFVPGVCRAQVASLH